MQAGIFNFGTYTRGDTYESEETFTIKEDGVVKDLTGAIIRMMMRDKSGYLKKQFETGDGITIQPGNQTFKIDQFNLDMPAGIYQSDLEVTWPSGVITTYIKGTWVLQQDQTHGY